MLEWALEFGIILRKTGLDGSVSEALVIGGETLAETGGVTGRFGAVDLRFGQ